MNRKGAESAKIPPELLAYLRFKFCQRGDLGGFRHTQWQFAAGHFAHSLAPAEPIS